MLYRFPIREHICFKLEHLLYKAYTNHFPSYISSMVTSVNGHSLLSPISMCWKDVVPGTCLVFGQRSFTVPSPSIWNSLQFMSAISSPRLSFALNSKLTSSALPIHSFIQTISIGGHCIIT